MHQSVTRITASYNEQKVICNKWLFELQQAVLLEFATVQPILVSLPVGAYKILIIKSKLDQSHR